MPDYVCSHHSLLKVLSSLRVEMNFYYAIYGSYFYLRYTGKLNKHKLIKDDQLKQKAELQRVKKK